MQVSAMNAASCCWDFGELLLGVWLCGSFLFLWSCAFASVYIPYGIPYAWFHVSKNTGVQDSSFKQLICHLQGFYTRIRHLSNVAPPSVSSVDSDGSVVTAPVGQAGTAPAAETAAPASRTVSGFSFGTASPIELPTPTEVCMYDGLNQLHYSL